MDLQSAMMATLGSLARESLAACDGVLVRIWTIGPGDSCATCPMRPECPDQRACLHLVVSAGVTTRVDGPFRRFPIGARRVGRVVSERTPYVERSDLAARGLAEAAWLAVHGVRSFVAVPLGGGRGVLALFSRRYLSEAEVTLLALAARAATAGSAGPPAPAPGRSAPRARAPRELESRVPAPVGSVEGRTLAEIERQAIERVLTQTRGRISGPRGAATILGLKPSTLVSRMQKLGVRRPK